LGRSSRSGLASLRYSDVMPWNLPSHPRRRAPRKILTNIASLESTPGAAVKPDPTNVPPRRSAPRHRPMLAPPTASNT